MKPWKKLGSVELYRNKYVGIVKNIFRIPSGKIIDDYITVELADVASVVATTPTQKIVFVNQHKPAAGRAYLDLPAGYINGHETPLQAAKRELMEETGYIAEGWRSCGMLQNDATRTSQKIFGFTAVNARPAGKQALDDTEDIEVVILSKPQIRAKISRGEITSSEAIAFLLLAWQGK